jgi:hypothetical protein
MKKKLNREIKNKKFNVVVTKGDIDVIHENNAYDLQKDSDSDSYSDREEKKKKKKKKKIKKIDQEFVEYE